MRILLVTVRSDFGGGPKHVDQIISGLSSEFEFFIAAPKGAPFGDLWMSSNMVNGFIEIPFRKFSVISLYRLLQFVRRNRISVIHSHGNGAGVYSRFLKMINPSLRVIHTFHGIAEGCMGSVKTLVFRTLSFFSDWSVFVSSGEQQIGVNQGFVREGKHSVIYNGINPPAGDRSDRSLRKCPFCVLTLSRFDYQKNMHLAYEIAKRMMVYDFIKFIWVGDGPDYQELHSLSKEEKVLNIQFVGFSEQPQRYLRASDLYLSTSRFEGLPYGLIEATSFGLPIVATNVVGNNEVAINGRNAVLFNGIDEAISAILSFYYQKQKYDEAAMQSFDVFDRNFRLSSMLSSIRSLYLNFAG